MSLKLLFEEHIQKSNEHYKRLWADAIFVLDTNVLLNLYRFSDKTRDKLIETLETLKDRLWIPYWVGKEYFKNRPSVIASQISELSAQISGISTFIQNFESRRKHPHLADDIKHQLLEIEKSISEENANTKKLLEDRLGDDDIMLRLIEIIGDNIGDEPTEAELTALITDGEIRFKTDTPPGFADYQKKKKEQPKNIYAPIGDLIIWDAMKQKARQENKPVVFICDDEEKGDWVQKQSGRTIGPLPSLLKEFKKETGQDFHIYNSFQFLNYYQDQPGEEVDEEVLDELREFQQEESIRILGGSVEGSELGSSSDTSSSTVSSVTTTTAMQPDRPQIAHPHFKVIVDPAKQMCFWQFYGFNNYLLFTSLKYFFDIPACNADIKNIQFYAQRPSGLVVVSPFENKFTIAIYDNANSVAAQSSFMVESSGIAYMLEVLKVWLPTALIF